MKNLLILLTTLFILVSFRANASVGINNYYTEDEITYNLSTTQTNPLYIKLYLILLKPESGPGGWNNQDIAEFENLLEQIYGIREIYFNLCVFEIKDSYWYGVKINEGNISTFLNEKHLNFNDGIKGVVGASTSSPGGGALGIPGKAFHANTINNAAHELGHNLGLLHTWEAPSETNGYPDCGENAPYIENGIVHYGANAAFTGDLVEDTPADLTRVYTNCPKSGIVQFKILNNSHENCVLNNPLHISDDANPSHEYRDLEDPVTGLNSLANNIMSYNGFLTCRIMITPGQAERIRNQIQSINEVVQNSKYTNVYTMDYYIAENTVWDNKQITMNGNIYVLSGINFVIKDSEINFAPEKKIYLHEGSDVIINNSVLDVSVSSNCFQFPANSTWGGIQYDYSAFSPNSNTTMLSILNTSYIYNAENAISNFSVLGTKRIYLRIDDSYFVNNRTSLNISNSPTSFIRITDSNFTFNRPNDTQYKAQMYLTNVLPSLSNVNIINTMGNIVDEKFCGIDFFDSYLMARNLTCKGWYYGLKGTKGKLLRINESEFINNGDVGIKVDYLVSTIKIKDSKFENNLYSGIYTDEMQSSDIEISNNIFGSSGYGINIHRNVRGFFYNNLFKNDVLYYGVNFYNRADATKEALFLCNIMNNQANYEQIKTQGGIYPVQAGYDEEHQTETSAGNKFRHDYAPLDYNFSATMQPKPAYKFYKYNPLENPVKNSGIEPKETVNASLCPENYFGEEDDYTPGNGDTSDEEKKFNDTNNEYVAVQDTINIYLDGGNTQVVISVINNANSANAGQVTQFLTGLGPWLSEEASISLIDYAEVFTGTQIVNIFAASPDILLNETVYQFCFGSNSPLSVNEQNTLISFYGQSTPRTRLLVKLNYLDMKKTHIIGNAVEKVVFTIDGSIDYNNLRSWYGKRGIFRSRFDIAQSFMDEGDYTGSINYLRDQLTDRTLTGEEINELNYYIVLTQLLVDVYNDRRYEGILNRDEIIRLEQLANTGTEFAQGKARGILEFFYGYVFTGLDYRDEKQWNFKRPANEITYPELAIMPNPSNGEFEVINGLKEKAIASIRIYSLDGQLVYDKKYPAYEGNLRINLYVKQGTFLYLATDRSGKVYSGKLIVE